MKKRYILLSSLLLLTFCITYSLGSANAESRGEDFVYVTKVEGTIDAGVSHHLNKAISRAERDGVPLVIKLDTPGGLVSPTKDIVDRTLDSNENVVVWVTPEGAWAYSAGTYILMASDVAAMDNGTSIGAAEPHPSDNKTVAAMGSWMGEIAEERGRPSGIAGEFVTKNRTMGSQEALGENIINLRATDVQDILEYMGTSGAGTRNIGMGLLSQVLGVLSHPQVVLILFIVGLFGILAEVTTSGVGLPGVVGAICLLLALWGLYVIEIWPLGLILLVLGVILIGVEILQPGFGIFGIGGGVSLLLGLWIIGDKIGGGEPWIEMVSEVLIWALLVLLALFVVFAVFVRRALKVPVRTGMESMVGETGIATRDIDPDGVVRVQGESWKATSGEPIGEGEEILVKDVVERNGQTTLLVGKPKKR